MPDYSWLAQLTGAYDNFKGLDSYIDQNKNNPQALADFQQPEYFFPQDAEYARNKIAVALDKAQKEQAVKSLTDFAQIAPDKYRDMTGTDDPRFLDGESLNVLKQYGFKPENYDSNPLVYNGLGDFAKGYKKNYSTRKLFGDDVANIAGEGGSVADLINLSKVGDGRKLSDFQSAVAGLAAPSRNALEAARNKGNFGYAPFSEVTADIQQAGASYGVPQEAIANAIEAAGGVYKNTNFPATKRIGKTSAIGSQNLLGDFKTDVQDTERAAGGTVILGGNGSADPRKEQALRKEFLGLPEVKDYPTIEQQVRRAEVALEKNLGTNMPIDQTVITTFNKILDPTSVVRESEYARTNQDLSYLASIKGKWDKVLNGGAGLTPEERQAMLTMIRNFAEEASKKYNARAEEYRGLAEAYGYDPARIVVRRNALDKPQASNVAPAGTKAKLKDGRIVTSDGKGGWN